MLQCEEEGVDLVLDERDVLQLVPATTISHTHPQRGTSN